MGTRGPKSITTEQFIEKARNVHGDRYNYERVIYQRASLKVVISCPEHGAFEQTPSCHLSGRGCAQCAGFLTNREQFVRKAQQIHGDNFGYEKVVYKNTLAKVAIICPEHGLFEQMPMSHLAGHGCYSCSRKGLLNLTTNHFIEKARQIHGSLYDYSSVCYTDTKTKVTIICPEHGLFKQTPNSHLRGSKCPHCSHEAGRQGRPWSRGNWTIKQGVRTAKLYIIRLSNDTEEFYKAGITFNSVKQRFAGRALPYCVEALAVYSSVDAVAVHSLESILKKEFRHLHYRPISRFDGCSECYTEPGQLIDFLSKQSDVIRIQ